MLKKIARRILKNEIEKLKQENKTLSKEYWDSINEHAINECEHAKKECELTRQIKSIEEELKNLSAENEIMRKYYRLDSEPTDEEKIKIRIDLRIHELEMQIIKERIESLEHSRTFIFPSPTPYYPSVFGLVGYR